MSGSLLLAVSGGIDSMVMLHILSSLQQEKKLTLAVAHIEHGLREESKADAEFVEDVARENNLQFYLHKCKNQPSNNIEAWGRKERYQFFEQVLSENNYQCVVTAHTASDLAETLLIKLLSNREMILIKKQDPGRKLLRPMLECSRTEVEAYAEFNNIAYRQDESNFSNDFLRNKIRNKILPFLQTEYESDLEQVLVSQAQKITESMEALDDMACKKAVTLPQEIETEEFLFELRQILSESNSALQWRITEYVFMPLCGFKIGYEAANRLLAVIFNQILATELPGGYRVSRSNKKLHIKPVKLA